MEPSSSDNNFVVLSLLEKREKKGSSNPKDFQLSLEEM